MCRSVAHGGRRCPLGADVRAIASAAQRVSRYHRRANDLALSTAELEHLQQLHSKALGDLLDRKDLRFPDPVPAPAASRSGEFTVEAVQRRGLSDEDLITQMAALNNDPHAQEEILQTLEWMDRRDRVDQERADREEQQAQEASWHDDRHDDDYTGGLDEPEPAPPTDREAFAAQVAVSPGRRLSKREQVREDYERYLFNQYLDAEDDCRGHMLTREGQAKGIDPASLFLANRAIANRYASDELKSWWNRNGHMSLAEYRYNVLGWDSDRDAARRRKDEFDAA